MVFVATSDTLVPHWPPPPKRLLPNLERQLVDTPNRRCKTCPPKPSSNYHLFRPSNLIYLYQKVGSQPSGIPEPLTTSRHCNRCPPTPIHMYSILRLSKQDFVKTVPPKTRQSSRGTHAIRSLRQYCNRSNRRGQPQRIMYRVRPTPQQ